MDHECLYINLVGDVMLGRLIDQLFPTHVDESVEAKHISSFLDHNPQLRNYGPHSPWGTALSLFQDSNFNAINLETSVTKTNKKWPDKVFNYRMHPDNVKALLPAQIDYASLANNHTLDFCEAGLGDTLDALKNIGVNFAGAGSDKEAAMRPAVIPLRVSPSNAASKHRHRVAIWSAADHPSEWARVPGFNLIDYSLTNRQELQDVIDRTSPAQVSLKVFSVHWGPNYAWIPADEIQVFAHFLIDECGVDIIHGHSSHHIQGVEKYKGKLIIYGCGDFVDDYALTPDYRNDLSAVWRVNLKEKDSTLSLDHLEIYPTKIQNFQAQRLGKDESDYDWFYRKFKRLCTEFGTLVDDHIGERDQITINLAS